MIALLIGSLALGMAAPMITKQIKQQNFQDVQFRSINKQLVPRGAVMFFDLPQCPEGWTNVNSLGWGGKFLRIANDENPRNVAQDDMIKAHSHTGNIEFANYKLAWSGKGGGCPSGTCTHITTSDNDSDIITIENVTLNSSPDAGFETRPTNIPLTTCRKN